MKKLQVEANGRKSKHLTRAHPIWSGITSNQWILKSNHKSLDLNGYLRLLLTIKFDSSGMVSIDSGEQMRDGSRVQVEARIDKSTSNLSLIQLQRDCYQDYWHDKYISQKIGNRSRINSHSVLFRCDQSPLEWKWSSFDQGKRLNQRIPQKRRFLRKQITLSSVDLPKSPYHCEFWQQKRSFSL